MAYNIRLYKTKNMVVVKHSGPVDFKELWKARKEAMELVHACPSPKILVDMKNIKMAMSTVEQFNFARAQNLFAQGTIKVAVVVCKNDPQFKDHHLIETIGQNRGAMLQVFDDQAAAKKWLAAQNK